MSEIIILRKNNILVSFIILLFFSSCASLKTVSDSKIDTIYKEKVVVKDSIVRVIVTDDSLVQNELVVLYSQIDEEINKNDLLKTKLNICESGKTRIKYKNIRNLDISSSSILVGRLNDLQIINSRQQQEIGKLKETIKDKSKEKPTEKIVYKECKKNFGLKDFFIWFGILCIGILIGKFWKKYI